MKRKEKRRNPRTWQCQPAQDRCEKTRGAGVKKNIHEMIPEGRIAPQAVLEPKRAVQKRVILFGGSDLGPDPPESMQRLQRGCRHVIAVVPDEIRAQRRQ